MKTPPIRAAKLSVNRVLPHVQDRQGKAALKTRALQTLTRSRSVLAQSRSVWSASDLSALSDGREAGSGSRRALLSSFKALTTASLLMLIPASSHAQGGVPLWTNRYNGPANFEDIPRAIALDRSGDVVVTGGSSGGAATQTDYATIKYSAAGVPLWTNRHDSYVDTARAIAVYRNGDVFVTGISSSGGVGGLSDYTTIKYSSTGDLLWINYYDGPLTGTDNAQAIALDSNGNVFVTGESVNPTDPPTTDYATIKYSSAGDLLWFNRYGPVSPGGYGNTPVAIAVDSSGNVFVTGASRNGAAIDYVTVKYANDGELLWTNGYNGPANSSDFATAIAVDGSGNVFVTGYSGNTVSDTGDYATLKYSNAGVPLWTNRYNGPGNGLDRAIAIAVDSSGNVFVTGHSTGSGTALDYTTIKYSNAGVPLWTNRYNGPGNSYDGARARAVDSSGNVFVTGHAWDGTHSLAATLVYSNAGVPRWTNLSNGGGSFCEPTAIVVDSGGDVFVTGYSDGIGTANDYVTIKYSSSVSPPRLDFQKLNNELVLSWTNAGFNLQTAPAVTGPFTNLPAATSPYTNPLTAPQQYFRLNGD